MSAHQGALGAPSGTLGSLDGLPRIAPGDDESRVHLWCFFYRRFQEPKLWLAYEALMTPEERARCDSFVFERDRRMFVATRALVRTSLSAYSDVDPAEWRFRQGPHGRPFAVTPEVGRELHFNLANTLGLVVCAVSRAHPRIGVDAERTAMARAALESPGGVEHDTSPEEGADGYLSSLEAHALRSLAQPLRREALIRYWTLKESYAKATGLGLALRLNRFSFFQDAGSSIRIAFGEGSMTDDPARWRFALLSAEPEHVVAVSIDTLGAPLVLAASNVVPLRGCLAWPPRP